MRKTIIITATIGFICIIISTFLQTVIIQNLDKNIDVYISSIDSCKSIKSFGINNHIGYKITEVENRIAWFEYDMLIVFQNNDFFESIEQETNDFLELIKQEILSDYVFLIKAYSGLFSNVSLSSNPEVAKNMRKTKSILDSDNDFVKKTEKLTELLDHLKTVETPKKLEKVNKTQEYKESLKIKYENKKNKINSWFLIFQIIGLILMSISGILEKFYKGK